jgi:hypothetical protein
MENTTVIHNESELIELIKDNQTSIYNVLNNRAYVKGKGHTQVFFSAEIKDLLFKLTVNVIGGRNQLKVRRFLNNGEYKHYTLERLFIESYNDKISVSYCAGQDYTAELSNLRKFIYSVV